MPLISALILLGILIFVHELGHFLFAKLMGVKVERFSIGFGPKLVGVVYGETEYRLSVVPLGGYVKMLGENPDEDTEVSEEDKPRAFNHQPVRKRLLIVLAGPVFNILFAAAVFVFVFKIGVPTLEPLVGEVIVNTPAAQAGLKQGDRILSIEGKPIEAWTEMTGIIYSSPGRGLAFSVGRGGKVLALKITPESRMTKNIFGEDKEIGLIGIKPLGDHVIKKYGALESLRLGFVKTFEISELTLVAFVKLIQRVIPADNLGGPILILSMAGERAQEGARDYFTFMAVISINLGIINLFPIPVLDGGHILFLGIEAVRRKPLNERTMIIAQKIGLALLLSLIAFSLYNDIVKVLAGTLTSQP